MRFRHTFPKGGIYPVWRKEKTWDRTVWNAMIPSVCVLPMLQHTGNPARVAVSVGDHVREGMVVGKADGPNSASIHSPIPGVVREIRSLRLPKGDLSTAVVIELGGEFELLGKPVTEVDWTKLSVQALLHAVREAGVVGMFDGGRPLASVFKEARAGKAHTLILNGCESEPYQSSNFRLLCEKTSAILSGTEIAAHLVGAETVYTVIDRDHKNATRFLRDAINDRFGSSTHHSIVPVDWKYPQGDYRQLIRTVLGMEIAPSASSITHGVVVLNVSTLFAVYEAVVLQKPVLERVVTVAGDAVRSPANIKVRLGTRYRDLFEECGGLKTDPYKIVCGGPMTGYATLDLDTPVTKGTSSVLALTRKEVHDRDQSECVRCGRCVRACPIGLDPSMLYKYLQSDRSDLADKDGMYDCIECGACTYLCPAHLPLAETIRIGKENDREDSA
jgi:Na+-translocating ferredoxin:NAD+ oxidoreductase subunit C